MVKLKPSEIAEQALVRELKEELDIDVKARYRLSQSTINTPDLAVQLRVFTVERFDGEVKSSEGQPFLWVNPDDLVNYAFPSANQPIIAAARLPQYYAILDDTDPALLLVNLKKILTKGVKLLQARLKTFSIEEVSAFLELAYPLCKEHKALLLLNSAVKNAGGFEVDGLHLTSADLLVCEQRPKNKCWVAASCHNLKELQHAQKIGVDFVVLAPVLPTPTHPEAKVLGWDQFAELVAQTNVPAFALGGLTGSDLPEAREAGAQGISGIRAFLM